MYARRVEAGLPQGAPRCQCDEGPRQLQDVAPLKVVRLTKPTGVLREVEDILAIDQKDGASGKNTRPGTVPKRCPTDGNQIG